MYLAITCVCMCMYLERFTIHPIKEIAQLYYLFMYISNEEEGEALMMDSIKDYAIYLVTMFNRYDCKSIIYRVKLRFWKLNHWH